MPPKTATAAAYKRIRRELMEYNKNAQDRAIYFIETVNGNLLDLKGYLFGPLESPFQGGMFKMEVKVPDSYPFTPPKVKFTTRVWHPNISSQTGAICLDILKDTWAPSLSLRTVMLSLQVLLTSPEADDPQDAIVARQYKEHPAMYAQTARFWTYVFAIYVNTDEMARSFEQYENLIRRLMALTRINDRVASLNALSCSNWNIDAAVQLLTK